MEVTEYRDRFLFYMEYIGIDHETAVIELESSLECYGLSDDPENDAKECLDAWIGSE